MVSYSIALGSGVAAMKLWDWPWDIYFLCTTIWFLFQWVSALLVCCQMSFLRCHCYLCIEDILISLLLICCFLNCVWLNVFLCEWDLLDLQVRIKHFIACFVLFSCKLYGLNTQWRKNREVLQLYVEQTFHVCIFLSKRHKWSFLVLRLSSS